MLKVGGCPLDIAKKIEAEIQPINVSIARKFSKFIADHESVFISWLKDPQAALFPLVHLRLRFFPGCVVKDFGLNCDDENYEAICTPIKKITMQASDKLHNIQQKHTVLPSDIAPIEPSYYISPIEIFSSLKIFGTEITEKRINAQTIN